jgi:hypothetical protein
MRDRGKSWLICFLILSGFVATASPLRAPRRIINGQVVNLDPLFQWWTNHTGTRPLSAWAHITGAVVGTNQTGWIVETHIETAGRPTKSETTKESEPGSSPRVLIVNPPVQDQSNFELLGLQLKTLNQQRIVISGQEAQLKSRTQVLTNELNAVRHNQVQAHLLSQSLHQTHQADTEIKNELKRFDQKIQELKTQRANYTTADHYLLDCFALDMKQEVSGMPLYDYGRVNF